MGVFGGTFDPPHVGHLVTAVNVRYALELDRVLLVVANVPWQKVAARTVSTAEDRLAMVTAAVASVDGLESSDLEIRRGGPSYTADTLAELRCADPNSDRFLILGSDAAAVINTWERWEELPDLATLVVVDRPGAAAADPPAGWTFKRLEVPSLEVSSTDLRARFESGRPLDYLVTQPVIDCIRNRRIYAGAE